MRIRSKAIAPVLILTILSLCVYSYFEYEHHLPYPTSEDILSDYQSYIGKEVFIFGTVTNAAGNTSIVSSGESNFTIAPISAKIGDRVEVVGTLEDNYRITAEKVLVYDRINYYSIFARSLIGATLLAFVFLKSWKFEIKKFKFVERK